MRLEVIEGALCTIHHKVVDQENEYMIEKTKILQGKTEELEKNHLDKVEGMKQFEYSIPLLTLCKCWVHAKPKLFGVIL